ncbi:hypothetical protein JCM11251_007730 [Rhodosporidiobolus azoricus]
MFAIRSGGEPLLYAFKKTSRSPHPIDDIIAGPETSYTLAYPTDRETAFSVRYRDDPFWDIELHEGKRGGVLKAKVSIEKGGGFSLSIPSYDHYGRIEHRQPFLGLKGDKFRWMRASPVGQYACWQVVEGRAVRKAARWKIRYGRGKGLLQVNKAFYDERELLLASAIGAAVSKFY